MNVIELYAPIGLAKGEISAKAFKTSLTALGKVSEIEIHVHSPGGSVAEGIAIGSIIEASPAKVTAIVEGGALSIASYIVMKCDSVIMADDAWIMIHNPQSNPSGESEDLRRAADMMDRFGDQLVEAYATRTGLSTDKIAKMMSEETWLNADEAINQGFADAKTTSVTVNNTLDVRAFTNVPQIVALHNFQTEEKDMAANIQEIKAACVGCSAEFVLTQLEAGAEVGSAVTAYAAIVNKNNAELTAELEALKAENEKLTAQIAAMEEAPAEEEEPAPEPEAEGDEDDAPTEGAEEEEPAPEPEAKKTKARAKPVARASGRQTSATAAWNTACAKAEEMPQNKSKADAVRYANRHNKGLRERMLAESKR